MDDSISRDKKELKIQHDKLGSNFVGELETQLREVKAKLINERIESKSNKLADMKKTMKDLESKMAKILERKQKEEAAKAEAKPVVEEKKEEVVENNSTEEEKVVEEEVKTEETPEVTENTEVSDEEE
jgi:protein subunit release factor A